MDNIKLRNYYNLVKNIRHNLSTVDKLYNLNIVTYNSDLNNNEFKKKQTHLTFNIDSINMNIRHIMFDKTYITKKYILLKNIIYSNFYHFFKFIKKRYNAIIDLTQVQGILNTLPIYDDLNIFTVFSLNNIYYYTAIMSKILSLFHTAIFSLKDINIDRVILINNSEYILDYLIIIMKQNNKHLIDFKKYLLLII
tara:strand:+ start:183 stop:767 length:585 start_codon:yes stop_codon:yes gene_type:complete